MRRQITVHDLTDCEILEKEQEVFRADADDDLLAYLSDQITAEALIDRLRYHKAQAKAWATTVLCDQRNQDGPEGLDGVA